MVKEKFIANDARLRISQARTGFLDPRFEITLEYLDELLYELHKWEERVREERTILTEKIEKETEEI